MQAVYYALTFRVAARLVLLDSMIMFFFLLFNKGQETGEEEDSHELRSMETMDSQAREELARACTSPMSPKPEKERVLYSSMSQSLQEIDYLVSQQKDLSRSFSAHLESLVFQDSGLEQPEHKALEKIMEETDKSSLPACGDVDAMLTLLEEKIQSHRRSGSLLERLAVSMIHS